MKLNETIAIHIRNIQWDVDEEDQGKDLPSTDFIQVFTGYDLKDYAGNHDVATGEFDITDDEIAEFLGEWLSNEFGFCHKGFLWSICSEDENVYPYHVTPQQVRKLIGLLGNLQDSVQDDIEFGGLKPSMEVIVAKDQAQDFLKEIIGSDFLNTNFTLMINQK